MTLQDAERSGIVNELIQSMPNEAMRGAAVFASTLPIICVYPFLQRYFVKGMTLGAVKE
jgi:putative aldouronate transport system permease protein